MEEQQYRPSGNVNGYANRPSMTGLGITGFVLSVLAIASSFVPIVNNISFVFGVVGFVFAAIGIGACVRGKRRGKGLSIAGAIIAVLSCVIVLWTQSVYVDAINSVSEGDQPAAVAADAEGAADAQAVDYQNLAVGDVVQLESGLKVGVVGIDTSLTNYDGTPLIGVTVTYENAGQSEASFNFYDWEAQNGSGVVSSPTYTMEDNQLSSGTLVPGGSVSGVVCFEGDSVKVLYSSNIIADTAAAWNVA